MEKWLQLKSSIMYCLASFSPSKREERRIWIALWKCRLKAKYSDMTNIDNILKSKDITLLTKVPYSQSYDFSSSHVWMWQLDHKEGWTLKNWCFWIVLDKTLESPLDCKEIQPVYPKGDQSCSLEGMMLKLKLQYFGHLMRRANSLEKTSMLGKAEGKRRRGQERLR